MQNKKGSGIRKLPWEIGARMAGAMLLIMAFAPVSGCTPETSNNFKPNAVMAFDTDSTPPTIPSPNSLAIQGGKISLSGTGIIVPTGVCTALPSDQIAACEFYRYLTNLDGYPTVMGAYAPIDATALAPKTGEIDISTVTTNGDSRNLFVSDGVKLFTAADLFITSTRPDNTWELNIYPKGGWDVKTNYLIAVRGYENGIKTIDGNEFVSSLAYYLLKETESLTCGASTGTESTTTCTSNPPPVSEDCKYYSLIQSSEKLCSLEDLRNLFTNIFHIWQAVDQIGKIPSKEVAIAWTFPTHSASVAQLDPSHGIYPIPVDTTTIQIGVKGTVQEETLSSSSIILVDLTALEKAQSQPDQLKTLMGFIPTFDKENGNIVLSDIYKPSDNTNLISKQTYGIFMTDSIKDDSNSHLSLVPSPLTVFLRSTGPISTADGKSNIPGFVSDADAQTIEKNRSDLEPVLDGIFYDADTRDNLIYVFAFVMP